MGGCPGRSPVIAEVSVCKGLHGPVSEEASPGDCLLPRGSQLGSRPTMLLVAQQLGRHLGLLDGNAALNVLKPHSPSQT